MTASRIVIALALAAGLGWSAGCEKLSPSTSKPVPKPAMPATEPSVAETPSFASANQGQAPAVEEKLEVLEERWPDGKLKSQRHAKRDKNGDVIPHGPARAWYEDSQLKAQGEYVNGLRKGLWTYWHPNGQKSGEGQMADDRLQGPWTYWHPNGQRKAERHWVDDLQHGPNTAWYENGQKAEVGYFVEGKPHGLFVSWLEDGKQYKEVQWDNGKLVSEKTFNHENSDQPTPDAGS